MGLIKAITGATGGVLADQWKEFIYCDDMPNDILLTRGQKKVSGRSSNTKGDDTVISNGSKIAVAPGQCMLISEQGKVVDICAEPGEYIYDTSSEPSIFSGDLSETIPAVLKNIGTRFTFGGEAPKLQMVYYINTRELMGNKYGTPQSVPFRIIDSAINLNMTIYISCFGEYSYRIVNPILFYTNVVSGTKGDFSREMIEGQLKSELLTALQPALAKLSLKGIAYDTLPLYTIEIADALNEILSNKWRETRGIEIISFGISSVKAREEDEEKIQTFQTLSNPTFAAAQMAQATAEALTKAASNEGAGNAMAFMGMNMAGHLGGSNLNDLYQMSERNEKESMKGTAWQCLCGAINQSKFCQECGKEKPHTSLYRCNKCGWQPENDKVPKFCPECGDAFDERDKI